MIAEHKAKLDLIPYVYVEGIGIMSGDNAIEHAPRPIVWDGYTVVDVSVGHELLDIPADGSPPLQDGEIDLRSHDLRFYHPQINDGMGEFNVRGMFWTIQVMELLANYDPADYQSESFGAEAPSYMADSDAHKLMEASWRINSFVESTEEYPQWWKSKLSVAASNVDDLADYLDYAMSDDYDAESFNAEDKKMVAFRYSDKSPAHICEGQGYTNTTRCGKPVNWDKVKNPFNLTAQKIDETLGSVDKKGMILHAHHKEKNLYEMLKKAESYGAETRSLAKRSWDALNNVETAVGTVGLAHMIGLGAIFGGSLAFLKGESQIVKLKSNIRGLSMAQLRTTEMNYEGMGDRVFQQHQQIMETLRDQIPTIEYDPSKYDPNSTQGSIFGGGTTHYSNGNRPEMAVNQAQMANNPSLNRTGLCARFSIYTATKPLTTTFLSAPLLQQPPLTTLHLECRNLQGTLPMHNINRMNFCWSRTLAPKQGVPFRGAHRAVQVEKTGNLSSDKRT